MEGGTNAVAVSRMDSGVNTVAVSLRLRPEIAYLDEPEPPASSSSHTAIDLAADHIASYKGVQFRFANTFATSDTSHDIFKAHREAVLSVCSGFDATLMAYGATGSGKTFTMLGSADQRGLMPLAVDAIFDHQPTGQPYAVHVSALELLEERCFDLLHGHNPVVLKSATKEGLKFDGLREVPVQTRNELLERIGDAITERTTAAK